MGLESEVNFTKAYNQMKLDEQLVDGTGNDEAIPVFNNLPL